jgi:hypothetical protein
MAHCAAAGGQPDKGRRVRLQPSGAVLGHLRTGHQSPDALAGGLADAGQWTLVGTGLAEGVRLAQQVLSYWQTNIDRKQI